MLNGVFLCSMETIYQNILAVLVLISSCNFCNLELYLYSHYIYFVSRYYYVDLNQAKYHSILKLIMLVNESVTFFIQNVILYDNSNVLKWTVSSKNRPKKLDFYVHLNLSDAHQRCRSISKLVRYYLKNVGNF